MNLNIDPKALLRIPGNVWVFWKDFNGRFLGCNDYMAAALGLSSNAEIIGKNDYDFCFLPSEADFYRKCDREVMSTKLLKQYYDTATLHSGKRLCLVLKMPLLDEDKVVGMAGISYNLNKIKHSFDATVNQIQKDIPIQIHFSPREAQCIHHLLRGKTAKQIAYELNLSYRTVEFYIMNLKKKLNVTTRSDLIEQLIDMLIE